MDPESCRTNSTSTVNFDNKGQNKKPEKPFKTYEDNNTHIVSKPDTDTRRVNTSHSFSMKNVHGMYRSDFENNSSRLSTHELGPNIETLIT